MIRKKLYMVSYTNTLPFLYGLQQNGSQQWIDLKLEHPAQCADAFLHGDADIALVPVAVLHQVPDAHLISPYCIGTGGRVFSVALFSQKPLGEVERIWLDYQSRTSVLLTRLLLEEYWNLNIPLEPAGENFIQNLGQNDAALIIGDRAMERRTQFKYVYDLGEAWFKHTGLPFTFAVWVANHPPSPDFEIRFNRALMQGLAMRDQIIPLEQARYPHISLHDYFFSYLDYRFDKPKKEALQLFLDKTRKWV